MEMTTAVNRAALLRVARPVRDHCRMDIRPAEPEDAAAIAAIYNHYVANTCITFETDAVSVIDMAQRIAETRATNLPWLLAQANGQVLGYAYASKWKGRCAYRHSVEATVYFDQRRWQGIGKPLYAALIEALRARAMHAVIGGIALPNDASSRYTKGWASRRWPTSSKWGSSRSAG